MPTPQLNELKTPYGVVRRLMRNNPKISLPHLQKLVWDQRRLTNKIQRRLAKPKQIRLLYERVNNKPNLAKNMTTEANNPFGKRLTKSNKRDKRFMKPIKDFDQALNDLYYKKKYFFGTVRLWQWFRENKPKLGISRRYIERWLSRQQLHEIQHQFKLPKSIRKHQPRAPGVLSVDLKDMQSDASGGYVYILVCYDLWTKKLYARPLKDKRASTVTDAMTLILDSETVATRGVYSDNGSEFISQKFKQLMISRNIKQWFSLPESPQSNPVERLNAVVARGINSNKFQNADYEWPAFLPTLINNYNDTYQSTIKRSPNAAEEAFNDGEETNIKHIKELLATANQTHQKTNQVLSEGSKVLLRLNHEKRGGINFKNDPMTIKTTYLERMDNGDLIPSYTLEDPADGVEMTQRYGNSDVLPYIPPDNYVKLPKLDIISYLVKPLWRNPDGRWEKWWVVRWFGQKKATYVRDATLKEDVPKLVKRWETLRHVKWKQNHTVSYLLSQKQRLAAMEAAEIAQMD